MKHRRLESGAPWTWSPGRILPRVVLVLGLGLIAGVGPSGNAQDEKGDGAPAAGIAARLETARTPEEIELTMLSLKNEWEAATAKLIEIASGEGSWVLRVRAIRLLGELRSEPGLVWCAQRVRTTFPLGIRGDPRVMYVPAQTLERAGWVAVPAILRHVTEGTPESDEYQYLADLLIRIAGHEAATAIVRRHGKQIGLRRGEDAGARVARLEAALSSLAGRRVLWPPPPPPSPVAPVAPGPDGLVPPPRTAR